MRTTIAFLVSIFSVTAMAHDHMAPAKVSPAFENMKALVGTWEGQSKMDGKMQPVKVTYELTSGGTALVEKLMPGTPNEMVTVYANRGDKVFATHYCAMGDQPEYALKNAKDGKFVFEMEGTKGLLDKNEMHMHGVTLAMNDGKLKQEWMNYNKGKKNETAVFEFTKTN